MARKLVYLLIFAIFGVGLWVYLPEYFGETNRRQNTRQVYVGYRGYAAQNKLLAAHRYLEVLGKKVRSQQLLNGVLNRVGQYDFIMLLQHGINLPRIHAIDLLEWVEKGGHLTTGPRATHENKREDSLFKELNITQSRVRDDAKGLFKYFDVAKTINIEFKEAVRFVYRGRRSFKKIIDAKGVLALRIQYGQGFVTVYGDLSIFNNARIAAKDHAALLSYTTHSDKPAEYWFIYGSAQTTLLQLVWKYLWLFLLALAVVFILWVWKASHRFGPMLARTNLNRRGLLEHIRAVASLQWNNNGRQNLLCAVRAAMQKRIELRHPDWLPLANSDLLSRLSQASGLSESTIDYTLNAKKIKSEVEFLTLIQSLNKIRNSL